MDKEQVSAQDAVTLLRSITGFLLKPFFDPHEGQRHEASNKLETPQQDDPNEFGCTIGQRQPII